jgi:probable F420-dependent oxidoreductase
VTPFRFGVNALRAGSRAEWLDNARKVEDLGYAVLGVPDHLAERLAPLPALVSAASVTTTLRIATTVLNNDFRHPVLLAREAATIDLLTDGRLELGMGAGYMKAEYAQAGLPFDLGGARVERLAEAVVIVKRLLAGKPVTFAGRHYRVTDHVIYPRPVQQPRPPLLIGGNGPRLLTLAANEADIVGLTGITFRRGGTTPDLSGGKATVVDERIRHIREAARERFERLELNALVQRVIVTDDRRQAAEELARTWTVLSPDEILASPYALIGTVDEMVEDLEARRRRWNISYILTHEPYLEALAPVVARLTGR